MNSPGSSAGGKGRASEPAAASLSQDEKELLEAYRKAKRFGHADLQITIQEGSRVKLWLTEKFR